jgi:hypothetical protein
MMGNVQSNESDYAIALGLSLLYAAGGGGVAGLLSMIAPAALLGVCKLIWGVFANDGSNASLPLTTSDLAGIVSALHPKTGALLHVAANVEARSDTHGPPPAGPVNNPVDNERL